MSFGAAKRRVGLVLSAILLGAALTSCSGFVSTRTQGYVISDASLKQIRPGQSVDLVVAVLGSPQMTNTFGEESAFYYIETKIQETTFGLKTPIERRLLAVYFDKNKKVKDRALYGLKDGKLVTIETRRTPSFGEDRTFIESIIASF